VIDAFPADRHQNIFDALCITNLVSKQAAAALPKPDWGPGCSTADCGRLRELGYIVARKGIVLV